jgi:hypothetical protein
MVHFTLSPAGVQVLTFRPGTNTNLGTQEGVAARLDLAFGPAIRRLSLAPRKTR